MPPAIPAIAPVEREEDFVDGEEDVPVDVDEGEEEGSVVDEAGSVGRVSVWVWVIVVGGR